jgi:hypothetical protein
MPGFLLKPSGKQAARLLWFKRQTTDLTELFRQPVGQVHKLRVVTNGAVTVWQDDVQVLNVSNVQTTYSGAATFFSLDASGMKVSPSPFTVYYDDVQINQAKSQPSAISMSRLPSYRANSYVLGLESPES